MVGGARVGWAYSIGYLKGLLAAVRGRCEFAFSEGGCNAIVFRGGQN
jgi:hypothetical protein